MCDSDLLHYNAVTTTLRLSRGMRILAPLGILYCLTMLSLSISVFWWDKPSGSDPLTTTVLVAMVAFWASIFAWGLVECLRHYRHVTVLDDGAGRVTRDSLFGHNSFDLQKVDRLAWRLWPAGGRIRLFGAKQRFTMDLALFDRPDQLALIRFVHRHVRPEKQEGWQAFCHFVALPLRSSVTRRDDAPLAPDEWKATRGRLDAIFGISVVVTTAIGVTCGVLFDVPEALLWPVLIIGLWLVVRFSYPRGGTIYKRSAVRRQQQAVTALGVVAIFSLVSMLFVEWSRLPNSEWYWLGILVVAFVAVVGLMAWQGRRDRHVAKIEAPMSVAEWEAAEAALPN